MPAIIHSKQNNLLTKNRFHIIPHKFHTPWEGHLHLAGQGLSSCVISLSHLRHQTAQKIAVIHTVPPCPHSSHQAHISGSSHYPSLSLHLPPRLLPTALSEPLHIPASSLTCFTPTSPRTPSLHAELPSSSPISLCP